MKIKNTECFLFNQIHSLVALKMCRLCKETKKLFRKISNLLNKRWNYLEKKDASTLALLSIFHKAVIVFLLKPKSGYSTLPSSWEGARSLSVFSPSQPLLPVSPITHPANHPVFSLVPLTPSHFKTLLFLPPIPTQHPPLLPSGLKGGFLTCCMQDIGLAKTFIWVFP